MSMEWRDIIRTESSRYAGSPGDAPPWQLVEAIVHARSGGDPAALKGEARGLALIVPGSRAYAEYVERYGHEPDLYDPADNIGVLTHELDRLQETGEDAAAAGKPAALHDWFGASLGFAGYADNTGMVNRSKQGDKENAKAAYEYDTAVRDYIIAVHGLGTVSDIDKLQPGSVRSNGEQLEIVGSDAPIDRDGMDLPGLPGIDVGNPVGQLTGFISKWAGRIGLWLLGLIVLGLGAWAVLS